MFETDIHTLLSLRVIRLQGELYREVHTLLSLRVIRLQGELYREELQK